MIGKQALRKLIETNDTVAFSKLNRMILLDPLEQQAYDYIYTHYNKYDKFPDIDTLQANYITLEPSPEPYVFYKTALINRFKVQSYVKLNAEVAEAYKKQDGEAIERLSNEYLALCTTITDSDSILEENVELEKYLDKAYALSTGKAGKSWKFGWPTLDKNTVGIRGGNIYAFVGATNAGKTWFLLKTMLNVAEQGAKCLILSLEMTGDDLWPRLIGLRYKIDSMVLQKGELDSHLYDSLKEKIKTQSLDVGKGSVLAVASAMKQGVGQLRAIIEEHKPDVVFIDAAYLLKPALARKSSDNKWVQISDTIEELKTLSEIKDLPIICNYQYTSEGSSRKNKNPENNQIAGSMDISRTASLVVGIVNVFNKEDEQSTVKDSKALVVTKNRQGPVDFRFEVNFKPSLSDFTEIPANNIMLSQKLGGDPNSLMNVLS